MQIVHYAVRRRKPRCFGLLAVWLGCLGDAGKVAGDRVDGARVLGCWRRPTSASAAISRSRLRHELAGQMQRAGGASGAYVDRPRRRSQPDPVQRLVARRRILASNTKLFTIAALLDRFPAKGTLKTRLYARPRDAIRGHTLRGSLVVVGAGDPALGRPAFARRNGLPLTPLGALANDVRRAGIKRVIGTDPGRRLDLRSPPGSTHGRRRCIRRAVPALGPLLRLRLHPRPLRQESRAGRGPGLEAQAARDRRLRQGRHRPRRPSGAGAAQAVPRKRCLAPDQAPLRPNAQAIQQLLRRDAAEAARRLTTRRRRARPGGAFEGSRGSPASSARAFG